MPKVHARKRSYPEGWFGSRTGFKELDAHIRKWMPKAEKMGCGYIYVLDYVDNKYKPAAEIRFFVKNERSAENIFKVGFTTRRDSTKRPSEQLGVLISEKEQRLRLFLPAVRKDGTPFMDTDIHQLLDADGYAKSDFGNESCRELYVIPGHRVKVLVEKYAEVVGIPVHFEHSEITLWPHQRDAVDKIAGYYGTNPDDPCFFLYVKCRGGKTIIALTAAVELGARRILIISFKPVNEDNWREDAKKIAGLEDAVFISARKGKNGRVDVQFERADKSKVIITYVSWQDLHNAEKEKHAWMKDVEWDLALWDEYHWGSYKGNPRALFFDEEIAQFKVKKHIFITGTGMNHVDNFHPDQVFSWTYLDERKAIENWDESKQGPCPYKSPRINIVTVTVPQMAEELAASGEFDEFSLNEFFATRKNEDGSVELVHYNAVARWLDALSGCSGDAKDVYDADSGLHKYPWADPKFREILLHTLWVLPSVDACTALADLMDKHPFFKHFKIINCAGPNGGSGREALKYVRTAIGDPMKSQSVTLTCRKLIDSVTVRCWSAVSFLCDIESLEMYIQTLSRCASEWLDGNGSVLKPECYVFDFSPFRAVKMRSEWIDSRCPNGTSPSERALVVEECAKFAPFISLADGRMRTIDAEEFMREETKMLSSLADRNYLGSVQSVTTDPIELRKAMNNPELAAALDRIPEGMKAPANAYNLGSDTSLKKARHSRCAQSAADGSAGSKASFESIRRKAAFVASRISLGQMMTDERAYDFSGLLKALRPDLLERIFLLPAEDLEKIAASNLLIHSKIRWGMAYFNRLKDEAA